MRVPDHQPSRHVLDPDELSVSSVRLHVKIAIPACGGVTLVVNNCRRYIHTIPAGELCSEIQVRVLTVEEEILIEKIDFLKHLAAVKCGGAAGAEYEARCAVQFVTFTCTPISPHSSRGHPYAGTINFSALPVSILEAQIPTCEGLIMG